MKAITSIFGFDLAIGCPFDDSQMELVEEWNGFKVGMKVGIPKFPCGILRGEIIAIGDKAKYLKGEPFVAFAVKTVDTIYFKRDGEIVHID